jgi:hypothetical protein
MGAEESIQDFDGKVRRPLGIPRHRWENNVAYKPVAKR